MLTRFVFDGRRGRVGNRFVRRVGNGMMRRRVRLRVRLAYWCRRIVVVIRMLVKLWWKRL